MRALFVSILLLSLPPMLGAAEPVKFEKRLFAGGDFHPHYRPPYPVEARRQGLTGSGVYILHIDSKTGDVRSVTVQKSTGHKPLDDARPRGLRPLALQAAHGHRCALSNHVFYCWKMSKTPASDTDALQFSGLLLTATKRSCSAAD